MKAMAVVNWLNEDVSGWKLIRLIVTVQLVVLSINMLTGTTIEFFFGGTEELAKFAQSHSYLAKLTPKRALILFLFAGFLEEIVFRLPLVIVRIFRRCPKIVLFIILGMSAWFGYMHSGAAGILLQGVGGLGFSAIFLKSGGMRGGKGSVLKGLLVVSIAHAMDNFTLYTIIRTLSTAVS